MAVISLTPGLGSLGDFGDWWSEPIVFQKFAVWTLLWEILGSGRRIDAAQLPLQALRSAARSTGCGRGRCGCRRGRTRVPLTAGSHRTPARRGAVRRGRRRRPLLLLAGGTVSPASRPGVCRPPGSWCCSACSACSGCGTRSPSSAPGRRSTSRFSSSRSSRPISGSSAGSSSWCSSGGAPPRRS